MSKLEKAIDELNGADVRYVIGVDMIDNNDDNPYNAYCLVRKIYDTVSQVILCKVNYDRDIMFKDEVENLAKYFNAKIYDENGDLYEP